MPRISEFFGIIIYMYWLDVQKHKLPHFHARFQGKEAVYSLDGMLLAGKLGERANRLVLDWCKENSTSLAEAWKLAIEGKEIPWIRPLQ